jgi:hypothetical protein
MAVVPFKDNSEQGAKDKALEAAAQARRDAIRAREQADAERSRTLAEKASK